MKFRHEVSDQKLRGGYYTPPAMVSFCLSRVDALAQSTRRHWLEPSAGDGAFVRGIAERDDASSIEITCIEVDPAEAAKCRRELVDHKLAGTVVDGSLFPWLASDDPKVDFDVVVGNPPYVRYQFLSDADRAAAERLASEHGLSIQGVSNAWILFALLTALRLRLGGVFCMVLPAEMIATISAGQFRNLLVRHFASSQIDMFQRGTFPGLLQDVVPSGPSSTHEHPGGMLSRLIRSSVRRTYSATRSRCPGTCSTGDLASTALVCRAPGSADRRLSDGGRWTRS